MPCFGPLRAWYSKDVNPETGKRPLVFRVDESFSGIPVTIPCGRCSGCRLERSRQWAMRCLHEKRMHKMSSFITLTYDDDHLPDGNTLVLSDLQNFMKRLRKITGDGLRFYACGEYGEYTARPHYHVLLLNYDFDDRKYYKLAKGGEKLYSSKTLDKVWSLDGKRLGLTVVGDVTFESCAYVARYIMKKRIGKDADTWYGHCPVTGVVRLPEFTCMSRRPGLGTAYFEKYGREVYTHDNVIVNGRPVRPPRFYDTKFEQLDAARLKKLKLERRRAVDRADNTTSRLRVKEIISDARLKLKGNGEL
ncbi:VP4 [Gokushovirus WZ-2015a]|nr:VP4 [Gokushovirus WZ-2015a]